jgi:hypothetical protein
MANWETWENFRYKSGCRFKVGDQVGLSLGKARKQSLFKKELARIKGYDAEIFRDINGQVGPREFMRILAAEFSPLAFQVVMTNFEKAIREWVVWIMSENGEVFRVEQEFLTFSKVNFKTTKAAISKGKTAREILGLPKEPPAERKTYRIIFKEERKNE